MRLTEKQYNFTKGEEGIIIKINEDCGHLDYKPIYIEETKCWRHPEDAIEYYKWVIQCIEKLKKCEI